MWKMFYELPLVYASDVDATVILDSTNTLRKYRIDANVKFKDLYDEIYLIYFNISKETLLKQNLDREFPIPSVFLISWVPLPSTVILEPRKVKFVTVSTFSPSICQEVMELDAMILFF